MQTSVGERSERRGAQPRRGKLCIVLFHLFGVNSLTPLPLLSNRNPLPLGFRFVIWVFLWGCLINFLKKLTLACAPNAFAQGLTYRSLHNALRKVLNHNFRQEQTRLSPNPCVKASSACSFLLSEQKTHPLRCFSFQTKVRFAGTFVWLNNPSRP